MPPAAADPVAFDEHRAAGQADATHDHEDDGEHDAEQRMGVLQRVQGEVALGADRDVAAVQGGAGVGVLVQTEDTIQAPVTNRKTAMSVRSPNPVQVAQPVTAVTATIPMKTGLIRRSLWRVVAVVMGLPGLDLRAVGRPDGTGHR